MNENAKKWVTALRTGKVGDVEVEQGRHALKTEVGTYCCLGVACLLAEQEGVIEPGWEFDYSLRDRKDRAVRLPDRVRDRLQLSISTGVFNDKFYTTSLAALNDREKHNFSQIADVIESEPEGLFL